jgi:hypothetical protein
MRVSIIALFLLLSGCTGSGQYETNPELRGLYQQYGYLAGQGRFSDIEPGETVSDPLFVSLGLVDAERNARVQELIGMQAAIKNSYERVRVQRLQLELALKALTLCERQRCNEAERDFYKGMGLSFFEEQYQPRVLELLSRRQMPAVGMLSQAQRPRQEQSGDDNGLFGAMLNNQSLLGEYRENAYGLGIHSDSTGRPFTWKADGGSSPFPNPLLEVTPNAYGLGVGSDQFGRPVRPACPYGMAMC